VIDCGVCGSGVGDGDGGGGDAAEVLKGMLVGSCNSEGVSAEDAASGSTDEGGSVMVAAAASAASASASIARISGGLSRNSRSFRGPAGLGQSLPALALEAAHTHKLELQRAPALDVAAVRQDRPVRCSLLLLLPCFQRTQPSDNAELELAAERAEKQKHLHRPLLLATLDLRLRPLAELLLDSESSLSEEDLGMVDALLQHSVGCLAPSPAAGAAAGAAVAARFVR